MRLRPIHFIISIRFTLANIQPPILFLLEVASSYTYCQLLKFASAFYTFGICEQGFVWCLEGERASTVHFSLANAIHNLTDIYTWVCIIFAQLKVMTNKLHSINRLLVGGPKMEVIKLRKPAFKVYTNFFLCFGNNYH